MYCFILFGLQVLKFLMERNSISALHGQVVVGTLILQVCDTTISHFTASITDKFLYLSND